MANKRKVVCEENFAWTTLATGERTLVSLEDKALLKKYSWFRTGYSNLYATTSVEGKGARLHSLIMPGKMVDFVNGDTLDNRRENLIAVDVAPKIPTPGVAYNKRHRRWQAYSWVRLARGGKQKHLGYFPTLEEAIAAKSRVEPVLGLHH